MKNILICLLTIFTVNTFAQKTDFSGSWRLDTKRTAMGQAPEWVLPRIIKVTQSEQQVKLSRININQQLQEQTPIEETLPLDGSPFSRSTNGMQVTTTLKWQDDHTLYLSRQGSSKAIETWTLADNGKTLVIDRQNEQADGLKYSIKCFYTKE